MIIINGNAKSIFRFNSTIHLDSNAFWTLEMCSWGPIHIHIGQPENWNSFPFQKISNSLNASQFLGIDPSHTTRTHFIDFMVNVLKFMDETIKDRNGIENVISDGRMNSLAIKSTRHEWKEIRKVVKYIINVSLVACIVFKKRSGEIYLCGH